MRFGMMVILKITKNKLIKPVVEINEDKWINLFISFQRISVKVPRMEINEESREINDKVLR